MEENIRSKYKNNDDYSPIIKVDEFGFIIESNDGISSDFCKFYIDEWTEILDSFTGNTSELKKTIIKRKLLQRGVPPLLRKKLWRILVSKSNQNNCDISFRKANTLNHYNKKNTNKEPKSEKRLRHSQVNYEILKGKYSDYEYQIHVDIQRTFRKHYLFHNSFGKGQLELFNVLAAFANTYEEIGYCQGMSDIGAIFLIHFSESEAYEMMVNFFEANDLTEIFDKKFSKLPQLLKLQDELMSVLIPEIYSHISKNLNSVHMTLISWYLTFFSRFPIKLALHIWDFMMFYGYRIILYFVCSILNGNRNEIMNLEGDNLAIYINKLHEREIDENEIVDTVIHYLKELKID